MPITRIKSLAVTGFEDGGGKIMRKAGSKQRGTPNYNWKSLNSANNLVNIEADHLLPPPEKSPG